MKHVCNTDIIVCYGGIQQGFACGKCGNKLHSSNMRGGVK